MQKIAAIDTGSNALRLVVADLDEAWHVTPVHSIRIPVRLGQDVFTNETLQETTIDRTVEAFKQFQRICDDFGVFRIKAAGTSAVREAKNRNVLIKRIYEETAIELEVISGEEEARLIHLAITSAMELDGKRAALVDIGGGSVEITATKYGNILFTNSYNLGTVRLLEKLDGDGLQHPPQTMARLLHEQVEAAHRRVQRDMGDQKIELCIATGGNAEEIGKLGQKLFSHPDDRSISVGNLYRLIDILSKMSVEERIQKLQLRPDRADVILPACFILKLVAEITRVEEILIPDAGLKNGLLLDLAQNMAEQNHMPNREQVWKSALRVGKKYQFDEAHGILAARLAGDLFDQTVKLHSLNGESRLILEIGALLHDIGHFINTVDHDRHGYYLLMANHILGLSEREQAMVASLVLFHRKGIPYRDERGPKNLSLEDRLSVTKLCSILRLADALDTSHMQRVTDASIAENKSGWCLDVKSRGDITLEKWTLLKRRNLFQEIFNYSLEFEG
jgi:exopolyphosphatase / guanosine-5'-triphosphate,3'-diphosphate pyrophosphatase